MMRSAAAKPVARKVAAAKKDVVVEVAVAAAPKVVAKGEKAAAPVVKADKPVKAAKAAAVVVAATPVEAVPAPVAAGPTTTLDEDLKSVTAYLNTVRETVASLLGHVKRLDKRVHREIKDARKRKRRVKVEEGAEGAKPRSSDLDLRAPRAGHG